MVRLTNLMFVSMSVFANTQKHDVQDSASLLQTKLFAVQSGHVDVDCATGRCHPNPDPPEDAYVKAPRGVCSLSGDPHIRVFDRDKRDIDYFGYGDFWLVKNSKIWIQGRYLGNNPKDEEFYGGKSWVKALAVSEPKVGGNKFIMYPLEEGDRSFTYNGKSVDEKSGILGDFATLKKRKGKHWGQSTDLYVITINDAKDESERTEMEIARFSRSLNVVIDTLWVRGTSGHCGNFDGNPDNDQATDDAKVGSAELLFPARVWDPKDKPETGGDVDGDDDLDFADAVEGREEKNENFNKNRRKKTGMNKDD